MAYNVPPPPKTHQPHIMYCVGWWVIGSTLLATSAQSSQSNEWPVTPILVTKCFFFYVNIDLSSFLSAFFTTRCFGYRIEDFLRKLICQTEWNLLASHSESDLTSLICTDLLAFGVGNCLAVLTFRCKSDIGTFTGAIEAGIEKAYKTHCRTARWF